MAKKEAYNPYANRDEEIRKAKGNPNKNVHAKKAGSNYGGYAAAERRAAEKAAPGKIPLPHGMVIGLAILFVLLAAALILRTTVLKDALWMTHTTSILVGGVCAFLFYTRRWRSEHQPELNTTLYKVIQVALCIFAVLYAGVGAMGLAAILK